MRRGHLLSILAHGLPSLTEEGSRVTTSVEYVVIESAFMWPPALNLWENFCSLLALKQLLCFGKCCIRRTSSERKVCQILQVICKVMDSIIFLLGSSMSPVKCLIYPCTSPMDLLLKRFLSKVRPKRIALHQKGSCVLYLPHIHRVVY